MKRLRVVVADDSAPALAAIVALLERDFLVVGTANNGGTALELVRDLKPEVAVFDLDMPVLNGIDLTQTVMELPKPPGVIICSVHHDPDVVDAAVRAGAMAYVVKSLSHSQLHRAVRAVARGERYLAPNSSTRVPKRRVGGRVRERKP